MLNLENIDRIQKLLKKNNQQAWIMCNKSNNDKYFLKYITDSFHATAYIAISTTKCYLLIHELDKNNIEKEFLNLGNLCVYIYSNYVELKERLEDIIAGLKFVSSIALTYSTMADANIDILGHGEYVELTSQIKEVYSKYSKRVNFESAEKIVYELCSQKTDNQIYRLKIISGITASILEKTFEKICVGMSEIDIAYTIKNITGEIMRLYIGSNDIIGYELAWQNCPIVLTGVNLTKGGHSEPSDKLLQAGDTIYFDYGIGVKFKDSEELFTDLQRMGYVLKKNEKKAPRTVDRVFKTLVKSIESGMEEMRPSIKSYVIDDIVRGTIIHSGYPNYGHATGHPVGNLVHDIGAIITYKTDPRSNLDLVKNGVYTLEPRIAIPNGGSIEEMILVTEFGGIALCNTQKKLYIVKG